MGPTPLLSILRQSATAGVLVVMTMTAHAQVAQPSPSLPRPQSAAAKPAARPSRPAAAGTAGSTGGHSTPPTAPAAPSTVPINRNVIVLDPAHGGVDSGSQISDKTVEKDVTLALAFRLRSLLTARGFTVVMTRDADAPSVPSAAGSALTLDDRAGIANHARAAACIVLHATGSGTGVHLYRSELEPSDGQPSVVPWLTAQSAWISQSQRLESQLSSAFSRSGIALVASTASVRPMDSLSCPALVVELAPSGDDADSINDTDYQQRVALSVAGAILVWQNQVQPPVRLPPPARNTAGQPTLSDALGAQP